MLTTSRNRRRALVTGAAGFIGSHLCDRLLQEGWEVVGLDNFLTGRRENLAHLAGESRFDLIEADVEDGVRFDAPLDWILHFASPASPPKYQANPVQCMRTNGEGTHRMLELARDKGASFFLASTSEVYGDPKVHPQVEDYRGNVSTVGPRSMYDEAKRYAEAMTMAHCDKYGVDARIIRIFNTYGPRMAPDDGRVISNFVCQALKGKRLTIYGEGDQTRSFQYVDDLVDGVRAVMDKGDCKPVNLGNPDERTILELAELVQEFVPAAAGISFHPLPKDDPTRRKPDITRARQLVDWQPRISLRDGLERTIAYFERQIGGGSRGGRSARVAVGG